MLSATERQNIARFSGRNSFSGWVGQNVVTGMESPTCDLQHLHQQALYFCSASFLLPRWRKTRPRRPQQPPARPRRHCKWLAPRCVRRAPPTCRSTVLASSAPMGLFANACAIIGPSYRATASQRERACAASGPPRRQRTRVKAGPNDRAPCLWHGLNPPGYMSSSIHSLVHIVGAFRRAREAVELTNPGTARTAKLPA